MDKGILIVLLLLLGERAPLKPIVKIPLQALDAELLLGEALVFLLALAHHLSPAVESADLLVQDRGTAVDLGRPGAQDLLK